MDYHTAPENICHYIDITLFRAFVESAISGVITTQNKALRKKLFEPFKKFISSVLCQTDATFFFRV